jgi:hypothetical protein
MERCFGNYAWLSLTLMILGVVEAYAADPQGSFDVKVLKGKLGDMTPWSPYFQACPQPGA